MEVHLVGTPQQHINLVRRALDPAGRRIVGHVMVSYPVPLLQQVLAGPTVHGYVELQQRGGNGTALVLAKLGEASRKQGGEAALTSIGGSRWSLALWPGDTAGSAARQMGMIGLAMVGIAAGGLALLAPLASACAALLAPLHA